MRNPTKNKTSKKESFTQKFLSAPELRSMEFNHIHKSHVLPLSDSIELWCVSCSWQNLVISFEAYSPSWSDLRILSFLSIWFFSFSFVYHEPIENFILNFKKISMIISWVIIDECHKVSFFSSCMDSVRVTLWMSSRRPTRSK